MLTVICIMIALALAESATTTATATSTPTSTSSSSSTTTSTSTTTASSTTTVTTTTTASSTTTPTATTTTTSTVTTTTTASSTTSSTPTSTATNTATGTTTRTLTSSSSRSSSNTPTATSTPSITVTRTPSPTITKTPTDTNSPTKTKTTTITRRTRTDSPSNTISPSPTSTKTSTATTRTTNTATRSGSFTRSTSTTASGTQTKSPSPTATRTRTPSASLTGTASGSRTLTSIPTKTESATLTATPSRSSSYTPITSLFLPCAYPCNIVIAYDESSATSPQDFQLGIRFLKDFVNRLGTAGRMAQTRIALVSIAQEAQIETLFQSDYRTLLTVINSLKQRGGSRNIDDSINLSTLLLNSASTSLPCGVILLVAFGKANNLAFAINSANVAISLRYQIVTVTTGADMSDLELNAYSSKQYRYRLPTSSDIVNLGQQFVPCGTSCGNGYINIGETCDSGDFGTLTCMSFGFQGGVLSCTNCQTNTSLCTGLACGNGILQQGEQCDGSSFGGSSCQSLGFSNGTLQCLPNCTVSTVLCNPIACGNGIRESTERCDGGDLGGSTCTSLQLGSGTLRCTSACLFNTSLCLGTCGNSIIEGFEQCDLFNLNNFSCTNFGFNGGILRCSANCQYSTSQCLSNTGICGNGVLDPGELCDTLQFGAVTCSQFGLSGSLTCTSNCQISISSCTAASVCGNGIVNDGEQCDLASIPTTCLALGFAGGTLSCSSTCRYITTACTSVCGNGVIEGNEACDGINIGLSTCNTLGYPLGQLSCNAACQYNTSQCFGPRVCGNGVLEGQEKCDDRNTVSGDGCDSTCNIELGFSCISQGGTGKAVCSRLVGCGNGLIEIGEQCDDQNNLSNDGCSALCTIEPGYTCLGIPSRCSLGGCGDGILVTGELCDDGNNINGDGCSSTCVIEFGFVCSVKDFRSNCTRVSMCGNNVIDSGEQCDRLIFGNVSCSSLPGFVSGSLLCTNTCTIDTRQCTARNTCGNGIRETGEQCDGEDVRLSCSDLLLGIGPLQCDARCNMNTSSCIPNQVCGNQILEGDESCDTLAFGTKSCSSFAGLTDGILLCSSNCAISTAGCRGVLTCGNGVVNGNEQCDDGNVNDNDGCSSACIVEPGYKCTTPTSSSTSACSVDRCTCETVFLFTEASTSLDVEFSVLNAYINRFGTGNSEDPSVFYGGGRVGLVSYTGSPREIVPLSSTVNVVASAAGTFIAQPFPLSDLSNGLIYAGQLLEQSAALPCIEMIVFVDQNSTNASTAAVVSYFYKVYGATIKVVNVRSTSRRADFQLVASPNEYYEINSLSGNNLDTLNSRLFPCEVCGDGRIGAGEDCEPSTLTVSCATFPGYGGGTLKCVKCKYDFSECFPVIACGNGRLDLGEQCDGGLLQDNTCTTLGFSGGTLACSSCRYNTQLCVSVKCGDGVVQGAEQCDDGNTNNGDGCSSACVIESGFTCFNSAVFPTSCTRVTGEVCGDRVRSSKEQCDTDDLNSQTCSTIGFASGLLACTNCLYSTINCKPLDATNACCANGACTKPILSLSECSDGNPSTTNDVCIAGVCKGLASCTTTCVAVGLCELSSRCIGGICYPVFRSDLSACGNGNVCYKGVCTTLAIAGAASALDGSLNVDFTTPFKLNLVPQSSPSPVVVPVVSTPTSGNGTTIGIVLGIIGGVLLLILLLALAYYLFMRPMTVSFQPVKDVAYTDEYYPQESEVYQDYQEIIYPTYAQELYDEPQYTYDPVAYDGNYASTTYGMYNAVEGYGAEGDYGEEEGYGGEN